MNKKDFEKLIDKHMKINERELRKEQMKQMLGLEESDTEEMIQAHAGACTALKMLKMEINGEKAW